MPPDLIPSDYAAWLEAVNANDMPFTPSPGAGPATPSIPAFASPCLTQNSRRLSWPSSYSDTGRRHSFKVRFFMPRTLPETTAEG
jgi:hypothetical protein